MYLHFLAHAVDRGVERENASGEHEVRVEQSVGDAMALYFVGSATQVSYVLLMGDAASWGDHIDRGSVSS